MYRGLFVLAPVALVLIIGLAFMLRGNRNRQGFYILVDNSSDEDDDDDDIMTVYTLRRMV